MNIYRAGMPPLNQSKIHDTIKALKKSDSGKAQLETQVYFYKVMKIRGDIWNLLEVIRPDSYDFMNMDHKTTLYKVHADLFKHIDDCLMIAARYANYRSGLRSEQPISAENLFERVFVTRTLIGCFNIKFKPNSKVMDLLNICDEAIKEIKESHFE